MLFASKTVTRRGNTADGSSFSDFEKEEKDHKHSIYSCLCMPITMASGLT